jgi:very-short-patch-repair endonuclease
MAPRSRREIFLATELAHLYQGELGDHKIISTGRIIDADIIIRSHKLVVEYDGSYWHQNKILKDKEKITKLRALGWRIIRIREAPLGRLQKHDVTTTDREPLHEVVAKVLEAAESLGIRATQSSMKYRRLGQLITADTAEKRVRELLKTPQSAAARSANARWNAYFNELIAFGRKHKRYEPSVISGESAQKLRRWVRAQRIEYQSGRLLPQRVIALEGLDGWNWEHYDSLWEKKFSQLQNHSELTRSVHIRKSNNPNKESLRHWVINQRILKRRNRLTSSRVARLESLSGWSWNPLNEQWQDAFQLLLQFVARHGTSDVKQNHIEDGFKLGIWLNKQRGRYRRGNLPPDRIQLLESQPDWKWEPRQDRTSAALAALRAFTARTGHSKVPIRHVEDGLKLGQFVYNVRGRYARRELSASLTAQLLSIPNWSWNR